MVVRRKAGRVVRLNSLKSVQDEDRLLLVLSALAEPTRLGALHLIWTHGEMCLCEIIEALDVTQSRASRHMAALVKSGILLDRRDAQWVRYRINNKLPKRFMAIVESSLRALPRLKHKAVQACSVQYKRAQ